MSFGSKGGVTVRLTVRQDDGSLKKVLTGTSCKRWYVQATETLGAMKTSHSTHGHTAIASSSLSWGGGDGCGQGSQQSHG